MKNLKFFFILLIFSRIILNQSTIKIGNATNFALHFKTKMYIEKLNRKI